MKRGVFANTSRSGSGKFDDCQPLAEPLGSVPHSRCKFLSLRENFVTAQLCYPLSPVSAVADRTEERTGYQT